MSQQSPCPDDDLKRITDKFWYELDDVRYDRHRRGKRWREYIEGGDHFSKGSVPLLQREIDCARNRSTEKESFLPKPVQAGCQKTLIVLIGESFQPLLQSVYVHAPNRLVTVANRSYGDDPKKLWDDNKGYREGEKHREEFHKYVGYLPLEKRPDIDGDCVDDEPTAVFHLLQKKLESDLADPDTEVIVDITGAKKTMVAGAFLLAAYTNAEIQYVDADLYKNGRPYGFACHFRSVDSPLRRFALREWQQIERLYRQNDFSGALNLLQPIVNEVDAADSDILEHLCTFLRICVHWENGELQEAKRLYNDLPADLRPMVPSAVPELFDCWPQVNDPKANLNPDLFLSPDKMLIYAGDELIRACRLLKRNRLRAAYTRAYALHETLLKARIIGLFDANELHNHNSHDVNWILRKLYHSEAESILRNNRRQGFERENTTSPTLFSYPSEAKQLRHTRNRVAHTYYPMTAQIVSSAILFAHTNFIDFQQNWVKTFPDGRSWEDVQILLETKRFMVPTWEEVKNLFKLNFIPVENR